jgi:outer membrane protein assembly factor BamE (lipoprotein component of BamABCDE complex)
MKKARLFLLALLAAAALLGAGCATVGSEFPTEKVPDIRLGETTREEIRSMFGEPWRTGVEDGKPTWTFARYRYSLFGSEQTKDLVLRFDDQGTVVSYTFNTTEPEENPAGLKRR